MSGAIPSAAGIQRTPTTIKHGWCAEVERDVEFPDQDVRPHRDQGQEDSARKRDERSTRSTYSEVFRPGRMPGMKPPYFFMFVRHVLGFRTMAV